MKILITPHDIIERALWQKYEYYILDDLNQEEIDKLVEENKEFEINEKDALVIGLISCIETENLKHRFNQHMMDILSTKSTEIKISNKSKLVITKNSISYEISNYLKNFPNSWNPKLHYKKGLETLREYLNDLSGKLEKLDIHLGEFQGNKIEYVQVIHVKKMLDFNH
jgi:hypothetical protein